MKQFETRYARNGGVRLAYQVSGQASRDLVFLPGFVTNIETHWEEPGYSQFLKRLSKFTRLIHFDKRGCGLSDHVADPMALTMDQRIADIRAVMDAAGSGRCYVLGFGDGAATALQFAAVDPQRVRALVLFGGFAHGRTSIAEHTAIELGDAIDRTWGTGMSLPLFAPERLNDGHFRSWWGRLERRGASPSAAAALLESIRAIDVRAILAKITVPVLLLHRSNDAHVKSSASRLLKERIPDARLLEFAGRDHLPFSGDSEQLLRAIEEFITGSAAVPDRDRVLTTLLVGRIEAPGRLAARLGDTAYTDRMAEFEDGIRDALERFSGSYRLKETGSFVTEFKGPSLALHCALRLHQLAREFGLSLATGVHVGEVSNASESVSGVTVHVAQALAARARANSVLVSSLVSELAAGSGLHFDAHGNETIDGVAQPLKIFALTPEQHLEPTQHTGPDRSVSLLSLRERQVLDLVAAGLSNQIIAQRLGLSEHTVKRHVANILLKLDLPSRAAAAALVGRHPES